MQNEQQFIEAAAQAYALETAEKEHKGTESIREDFIAGVVFWGNRTADLLSSLNPLKELVSEIDHYQNSKDIDYDLFDKVDNESNLISGRVIVIEWHDRDNTDSGYLFQLPNQSDDGYDFCVHVNDVDNSAGMGDAPDEFHHLYHLVSLEDLKKIITV